MFHVQSALCSSSNRFLEQLYALPTFSWIYPSYFHQSFNSQQLHFFFSSRINSFFFPMFLVFGYFVVWIYGASFFFFDYLLHTNLQLALMRLYTMLFEWKAGLWHKHLLNKYIYIIHCQSFWICRVVIFFLLQAAGYFWPAFIIWHQCNICVVNFCHNSVCTLWMDDCFFAWYC